MTPDQIIALNVQKFRKRRDLTVTRLADMMGVSRAKVYDYEHRAGRPHAFKWSELIELCTALECFVYELVDPQGETIDGTSLPEHTEPVDIPDALAAQAVSPPGREELFETVFGLHPDTFSPPGLNTIRQKQEERHAEWMRTERARLFEELRDLGAMTPDEYRKWKAEQEGDEE